MVRRLRRRHYSGIVPLQRITLIGKPGCHLCDDAREAIAQVIAELPAEISVELVEQSILDDDELRAQYSDEIPVVLINDRVHTIWRVESDRLNAALREESE